MKTITIIPNNDILNVDVYHKEGDETLGYEQLLYDFCACTGVNYDANIYDNLINFGSIIIQTSEELSSITTYLPDNISSTQKEYLENLRIKRLFNHFEYLGFHTLKSNMININSIGMSKETLLVNFYQELENLCINNPTR